MKTIPLIDVAPIFGPDSATRTEADTAILAAAGDSGFLVLAGLPPSVPLGADTRRGLLRLFDLPEEERRRLWRKASAPENPNVYRGYFPLSAGVIKEGMDVGAPDPFMGERGDALTEPTPLPRGLPGWRELVGEVFAGLDVVGAMLMRALARGLALPEATFDAAFRGGISTLRMIRYPAWPALAEHYGLSLRPVGPGPGRYDIGGEHVDSGFVTLLQQDGVEGLQARVPDGAWIDVPHVERTLVVNFGKLFERWTGGRIRATAHRVLGNDSPRCSIPFFYEPRVDARIEPLEIEGALPFEPFTYGDHLWKAISEFPEFQSAERFRR